MRKKQITAEQCSRERLKERMKSMGIKVKTTYCMENKKTNKVIDESSVCSLIEYYNAGKKNTIKENEAAVKTITAENATFYYLDDNSKTITVSADEMVEWEIRVADRYIVNERTREELQEGRYEDIILALIYYNEDDEQDVITKVGVEQITDTEVTFHCLSDNTTIMIPIDKLIDWFR